jgi:hypothetical protein
MATRGFQQILKTTGFSHEPLRLQLAPFELRGTQEDQKHVPNSKPSPNQKIRIMTTLHQFRDKAARYPAYQLIDLPPTPIETIRKARDIGLRAGLRYVYQGNVAGEGENTYCYRCGELLIERFGYRIVKNRIIEPSCPRCGVKIDGVLK